MKIIKNRKINLGIETKRLRLRIFGSVQGVGFRPFVFRFANSCNLSGWVRNETSSVLCEVQGQGLDLKRFVDELDFRSPPLAKIQSIEVSNSELVKEEDSFYILKSLDAGSNIGTVLTPDAAACDACKSEVIENFDRRSGYALNTCTDCGPRYTIIQKLPYDREQTTLSAFPLCKECRQEYDDPHTRRFHAEAIACPVCGPQIRYLNREGPVGQKADALSIARQDLLAGKVLAIKSLGGFHLVVDATSDRSVELLRTRKARKNKPFALMARCIETTKSFAHVSNDEEDLLTSVERPIVLLSKGDQNSISSSVAPNLNSIGVMLPLTPLHELLFNDDLTVLVATSANKSGDAIIWKDEDINEYLLEGLVDGVLTHGRPIVIGIDDSVVTSAHFRVNRAGIEVPAMIVNRRARGYAPFPLDSPFDAKEPILSVGSDLKNTFSIALGRQIQVSPHVGDLSSNAARHFFEKTLRHFESILNVEPTFGVADFHPQFHSTQYVKERFGDNTIQVQHHHAHLAACLVDNGSTDRVLGVIFDGFGYGMDGTAWGGEFIVGDFANFQRVGNLAPVALPGGDRAAIETDRMAIAYAAKENASKILSDYAPLINRPEEEIEAILKISQAIQGGSSIGTMTTSMGRLFDAVAAFSGVSLRNTFEGEAAMRLESIARDYMHEAAAYDFQVIKGSESYVLDYSGMISELLSDVHAGKDRGMIAAKFHKTVSSSSVAMSMMLLSDYGLNTVALSGGVFNNAILLREMYSSFIQNGVNVLIHQNLSPGDSSISVGQTAIALQQLR